MRQDLDNMRKNITCCKLEVKNQGEIKRMNIQIFGTKKCNDTKKAERFFKERGIKYQFIDMKEKGMSKGSLIRLLRLMAELII